MSWQIETMIILVSAFGGILGLGFIAVRIQIAAQTKRMRLYKPLILELIYATPGIEESKLFAEIQKKCSYAIMPLAFYHVLDELRDDMIIQAFVNEIVYKSEDPFTVSRATFTRYRLTRSDELPDLVAAS